MPRYGETWSASPKWGSFLVPWSSSSAGCSRRTAFSHSGNPDVVPELARHASEHIDEIRRLMAGGEAGSFDFIRSHAHRRAAQRFPLEAILHAYRCGHRVLARWMRDAALAAGCSRHETAISTIADFAIEYTD